MPADYRQYPFAKGRPPRGWVETTVGEVLLSIQSGFSSGKHNQTGEGIPHLRPMSVSLLGEITLEGVRYIAPDAGSSRLAEKDVLFTNTSSTVWVGKTAVVRHPGDWAFSNHMTRLRVGTGMDPEFVARQLHYLCMCGYFAFHCKKHINQSSIAGGQLAEGVPFRCPPAKEQSRITDKLTRLLKRERTVREALETLPALMQEYRAAVLEAACTGRLVPTEAELARKERRDYEPASVLLERILHERREKWESDQLAKMRAAGKEPTDDAWKERYPVPSPLNESGLPQLPAGWSWASLQELGEEGRPVIYGIIKPGPHDPNGVPYVRVNEMKDGVINVNALRRASPARARKFARATLKWGDILISKDGTIGKVAVVPRELEGGNITQHLVRVSMHSFLMREYFTHSLRSGFSQRWLKSETKGVALQGVNVEDFRQLPVPVPPRPEQERIDQEVSKRLNAIELIQSAVLGSIDQTAQLRVSLFHRAIVGKLAPQSADEDSAVLLIEQITAQRRSLAEHRKKEGRKKMKTKTEKTTERRDLVEILAEHPEGLTPERLLLAAGYSADEVPSFYQKLREAEGKIEETRPSRKVVLLKRRKP